MIIEIINNRDIQGFLYVAFVLIVGFSVAFGIAMPKSETFGINQGEVGGPFHGLLIAFQSMLGAFDLSHYEHTEAIAMFVVFAFAMVVVMLNLLIAIMCVHFLIRSRIPKAKH